MPQLFLPSLVSLTGADDAVDPASLLDLSARYPAVEWALLLFPEKAGTPRNPSDAWRASFIEKAETANLAAHLCGQSIFEDLLSTTRKASRLAELSRYGRIQVNINARYPLFSEAQVVEIYSVLLAAGLTLILQHHGESAHCIDNFLLTVSPSERSRIHVLFDASKGRGKLAETWPQPLSVGGASLFCGYAGGLSPLTLPEALPRIQNAAGATAFWVDMESGLRTQNQFDLGKAEAILRLTS